MATFAKSQDWVEYMVEGGNLGSDAFAIALSNTAPASESSNPLTAGNGVLANVTQISYTNYSDDMATDRRMESVTSSASAGTLTFDAADIVITASGGTLASFQYIYVYNDTLAGDPIVAVWDNGSAISLADTESVTIAWNASGIFTVA